MLLLTLTKLRFPVGYKHLFTQLQKCHSVFGIQNLIQQEKPDNFTVSTLTEEDHEMAIDVVKQYYLPQHAFVRARKMNLDNDRAFDQYLFELFNQGSSLIARSENESVAGVCINVANSLDHIRNLRHFAFYRQDPNIKDFLNFTAKMHEYPNLWDAYRQSEIFEINMLTVVPEFRRKYLAVLMTERSIAQAYERGFNVVRINCINPHDYKIAERCMLQCIAMFPLHKLSNKRVSYITKNSEFDVLARVYVAARVPLDDMGDEHKLSDLNLLHE